MLGYDFTVVSVKRFVVVIVVVVVDDDDDFSSLLIESYTHK